MTGSRALVITRAALFALAAFAAGAAAATIEVTITDLTFVPDTVTVHVGDTIEWTNKDIVDHTATAMNGDFDVAIAVGATGKVTLTQAGVLPYFCQIHPNMTGTITVLPR